MSKASKIEHKKLLEKALEDKLNGFINPNSSLQNQENSFANFTAGFSSV